MAGEIIKKLKLIMAYPFMEVDKVNAEVLIELLNDFKVGNEVLEIGPGGRPIIESFNCEKKIIIDIPQGIGYCSSLGYICHDQDAGNDKWDIEDESVDMIVSNQCLEHIPQTDHFISEAHRVLKKGGVFILSAPNKGSLISIVFLLLTFTHPMNAVFDEFYMLRNPISTNRMEKQDSDRFGHHHLRLFTKRARNDLLIAHSFCVLKNHGEVGVYH
ncbi:MAG: methyltransferase family protein [Methanobacterium sp. Maddingley MBC34]|nr:MAG: methyltransferase family protein [Methanobacterium sp. Maddingley MBC34]